MTDKSTYRVKRIQGSVKKFLNGEARRPYVLREDIVCGLKNNKDSISSSCTCQESLGKFSDNFKKMYHNNLSSGKQRKTINRNLQNNWLLANIFDSYGNYIFCFSCIKNILNVSGKRIHRLREIKRQQAKAPTIRIRKDQVLPEQIYDVVPPVEAKNVLVWWMSLPDNSMVEMRSYPKLHCGKSNNNKEELLPSFLSFIDSNCQPNGRRVGSHGPLFFLNSKFDRINEPSVKEVNKSENWKRRSLVYEYNRTIEGGKKISNGTAKKWLKTYRPTHGISPKKTDYCEMCVECQEQKKRHETIAMRLQQEGNGSETEIRENQSLAESYGLLLEEHKMDAGFELGHYRLQTNKSRTSYEYLEKITEKRPKQTQTDLQELKAQIIFNFSLDYQQSKLTPHWGFSAQPSETYYLRKLSHNIFGVVDHTLAKNAVYVIDERVGGSKNADMTISLIDHYLHHNIPSWARHICLFMDNGTTNKNQFMIQWAMELIERGTYDTVRMCFFVPGHGKNDADRLFSRISHTFNHNDVFVTKHLVTLIQDTIGPTGTCIQASNRDIVNWKNLLSAKYISLKDIKSYRDFLVKRNDKGKVVVYLKECCYAGDYNHKELLKDKVDSGLDLMKESKKFTYEARGMSPELSRDKVKDLVKMYDKFIDPSLRPGWLPISQSTTHSPILISTPSSDLARQHRETLKRRKR